MAHDPDYAPRQHEAGRGRRQRFGFHSRGRLACSPPALMLGDRPDQTLIGSHSAARKMRHASTPSRRSPSDPRIQGVLGPSFSGAILCVRRAEGVVGVPLAQRRACLLPAVLPIVSRRTTHIAHRAHTHSLAHSPAHPLTCLHTHRQRRIKHVADALR